jgi:enamine deaminase RidA (YjgF/YER057c/UK114 family)
MSSPSSSSIVQHSSPAGVHPVPHYNHVSTVTVTSASKLIYTAGQVGRLEDGTIPTDFGEQVRLAVNSLRLCLESAGAGPQDVVKTTYYVVDFDPKNIAALKPVFEYLGDCRPPTTLVPVPVLAMPDILFEIEAVAALK